MARALLASIGRGDFLTVRQSSGELVLDYGNSQRRFTPGAHSVVSAESGVADQSCGWKGREYVIEVRAQAGPDVTERSEEHTSELQSHLNLVCRLLLEKKKTVLRHVISNNMKI